jgi:Zn-dependent peptidase ImmA (M78 family)
MADTFTIKPDLIRWAVKRSGLPLDKLVAAFPGLPAWQSGEKQPTLKQLEAFARRTMTPYGYLFLSEPPVESLPVPDFRTKTDRAPTRPSPNLLDMLHAMQRRQQWMRDYLIEEGNQEQPFVASAKVGEAVEPLARRIGATLALDGDWSKRCADWEEGLRTLRTAAEAAGILVAASSVVGLNTKRKLNPEEFRGFVLADPYAPLIFLNAADSKSAQMFTLAHELVHVWLGQGGIFNLIRTLPADDATERYCNQVAAEFLVPADQLSALWEGAAGTERPFRTFARRFKVSPVVAARRALDLGLITKPQFFAFYQKDQEEWERRKAEEKKEKKGGPSFYAVQDVRLGRRFAYAVVRAAREGRLLYRDAYRLTDLKGDTFNQYANLLLQRMKDERG